MNLEIRQISFGSNEYKMEVALRSKILREPLGLQFTQAELEQDIHDTHIGIFQDSVLKGCLILSGLDVHAVKMRQVAVDNDFQGQGLGKKLVQFAEKFARDLGYNQIKLNARVAVVPFYEALNYVAYDEPMLEVTIPHRKMQKSL